MNISPGVSHFMRGACLGLAERGSQAARCGPDPLCPGPKTEIEVGTGAISINRTIDMEGTSGVWL